MEDVPLTARAQAAATVIVLPDTNVWLRWLRARATTGLADRGDRLRVYLSAIVLQELWAGARDRREALDLDRIHDLARQAGKLVTPPAAAWILSGQALAALAAKRHLGSARLWTLRNDVLFAASAVLLGATVLTENIRDFTVIAGVLPVEYRSP